MDNKDKVGHNELNNLLDEYLLWCSRVIYKGILRDIKKEKENNSF